MFLLSFNLIFSNVFNLFIYVVNYHNIENYLLYILKVHIFIYEFIDFIF